MLRSVRALLARLAGDAPSAAAGDRACLLTPEAPAAAGIETNPPVTAEAVGLPQVPAPPPSQADLARAQALAAVGKLDRAIGVLETSLRSWPTEEMATVLEELRTIRRARKRLQRHPDDAQAHFELGRALFAQERGGEALVHLERACRLRPGWPEAHLVRAMELHWQGRWHEAAAAYQTVLALDPAHRVARRGLTAVGLRQPPETLMPSQDFPVTSSTIWPGR
jgi:cytochrome c-type biogenesis protein CcmH/NrfG